MSKLNEVIETLKEREREINKELNSIRRAISSLEGANVQEDYDNNVLVKTSNKAVEGNKPDYINSEDTWIKQIIAVIKHKNRFLHTTEIAKELNAFYEDKDLAEVKRRVSSVLSIAKKNNTVAGLTNYQFSNSKKDTVWGKEDWLDNNGKPNKHYNFEFKRNSKNDKIEL